MLSYYLHLAARNARRSPCGTMLIIATLGLGIASCTIIFTVIYLMSADPIPHKSDRLYRVQLDNWVQGKAAIEPDQPPEQVTWTDSINIVNAKRASRQASMAFSWALLTSQHTDIKPFQILVRTTHGDMFDMFDMPFLYGGRWDSSADDQPGYLVVLSKQTNDRLFAGENSVGRSVLIENRVFSIVGVLDDWSLRTKFYDLVYGPYYQLEDVFMPFKLRGELELPKGGWTNCPVPVEGDDYTAFLASECVNYQLWVELQDKTEKQAFIDFLDTYVEQQRALGRFPRPTQNRLTNLMAWLDHKQVVSSDLRMVLWLALLFLLICVINASSLLASRFSAMRNEAGLRRALGASKQDLIYQYLTEAACLGLCGGLFGLLLAVFGLYGIKALYQDYQHLVQMDVLVMSGAIGLAVFAGVLSGILPILHSFKTTPATQLKQQV